MKARIISKRNTGLILLIVLGCILLFHTQYSFCQSDESFYVSTVKRLWQGDRLILDEWHPTQFYSPILLPFYALYRLVIGTDEGIIVFFRLLTVFLAIVSSLIFYREARKQHGSIISIFTAALLMLFSRANIAGASYYNLNLHFSVLAFVLWWRSRDTYGKDAIILNSLSGLFLSLAVLCQPYTAVFAIGFLLVLLMKPSTRQKSAGMIVTVLAVGVLYIAIFLLKGNLGEYLTNIKYVLNDPQHQGGIIVSVKGAVKAHFSVLPRSVCIASAIMSAWFLITRKQGRQLSQIQRLVQICLLGISLMKPLLKISTLPCYSIFAAITMAGLPSFLFYFGRKETRAEIGLYILGICLAVCWMLGSNTGLDAMLVGYVVSGTGVLLLIDRMIQEDVADPHVLIRRLAIISFACACSFVLLFAAGQRILGFYRDAPITQLNTRISQGPAKGLLTTAETAEQYHAIYSTITKIHDQHPEGTVIHMKRTPWAYLCCDWKCNGPTTWTTEISESRLMEYYNLHGGSLPEYWFIYDSNAGAWGTVYFNNHKASKNPNQMELSGDVYSILNGGYSITKEPFVTVYAKKAE